MHRYFKCNKNKWLNNYLSCVTRNTAVQLNVTPLFCRDLITICFDVSLIVINPELLTICNPIGRVCHVESIG